MQEAGSFRFVDSDTEARRSDPGSGGIRLLARD